MKHQPATPLPWSRTGHVVGTNTKVVADCGHDERDAAFIVHACENYQFLVRALKAEMEDHAESAACASTNDGAMHHTGRANNIRALLKSMGEL